MRSLAFSAIVESRPRGGIVIPLPTDPDSLWGDKDHHYVAGSIEGRPVRGLISDDDGRPVLALGPAWCRDGEVVAGMRVAVLLEPEGPQFEDLPTELRDALAADPGARRRFESLATFYRKGFVGPIAAATRPTTRTKRSAAVVEALRAGRSEY
jgi:Bacteriocin-protection, YdeI or OmpD-Associated